MTIETLLKKYYKYCTMIVDQFIYKYFCDHEICLKEMKDYTYAIGGEVDGIYQVSDYYISFSDMVTCIKFSIPEKTFFAWYDHSLECHAEGRTYANLENYYLMTKETLK